MKKENIFIHLLSIFCMFFLSGLLFILGICIGFFSDSGVLKALYTSEYYTENYKVFVTSIDSILTKAEIPTNVITDVIQERQFYIAGRTFVSDLLSENDTDGRTKEVKQAIRTQMDDYFLKKYVRMDETGEEAKETLCDEIYAIYLEGIQNPFVSEIVLQKQAWNVPLRITGICLFLLIVLSAVVIIWLSKYKYRGVMQLVYACLASGVLNLMITMLIEKKMDYSDLSPDYYVLFLQSYITASINCIRFISLLLFVLAIILYFLAMKLKKYVVTQRMQGGA